MLLGRSAHNWSFYLLESTPNTTSITNFHAFLQNLMNVNFTSINHTGNNNNNTNNTQVIEKFLLNASESVLSQAVCIQEVWEYLAPSIQIPSFCLFNKHTDQTINPILEPWNPHLILLTICCIQSIICISRTHINHRERISTSDEPPKRMIIPLHYAAGISMLLIFIIAVLEGLKDTDLVQYPTIITVVMLTGLCIIYISKFSTRGHDLTWGTATHLQLVGVPLAILAISTMGARFWTDLLGHTVILYAAVNCLWLQCNTKNANAQRVCHILTIVLPLISLYQAHIQWGQNDNWRYVIGSMACGGLAPLFLITLLFNINPNSENKENAKQSHKLSILCSSAALLSFVVNLALFQ